MTDARRDGRQRFGRSLTTEAAVRIKSVTTPPTRSVDGPPVRPAERVTTYPSIKAALQAQLIDEIERRQLLLGDDQEVAALVRDFTARAIAVQDLPVNDHERDRLAAELVDETLGLGPLAPLLADPAVSDVLVNRYDQIYVERYGRLEKTGVRFLDQEHIVRVIERMAARVGRRIDTSSPMADLRLPDGSRVNATLAPVSLDGPTISIRRFGRRRLRQQDLLGWGTMSPAMLEFLSLAVEGRRNILISGGTGAGKSTLLGALAESIPASERIVTIEDTAELVLDQEHVVRLESRPPNVEGRGRITTRDLLINSLRMRPDRIIIGEVRGDEALDMLQAMNTGHDGSLCTLHANSPRDALSRLETLVLLAGTELPSRAAREQIVSAIQLLVHVRRHADGVRRVDSIAEITGLEGATPLLQELFVFRRAGRDGRRVLGEFTPTGIVPRMVEDLKELGVSMPLSLFHKGSPA